MAVVDAVLLRGKQLRNRLVFGPHVTNLGAGRALSDRHVAYYTRRAAGGVGLIVTEEASVHALDWPYERAPLADRCEGGWRSIARACRAEGAVVVAGLGHSGLQGSSAYSQREIWAPSRVADAVTREQPKEMEPADIDEVLAGFARSAARAAAAGMDGVEINAGQYSLVRQFLSGLTNLRTDEWGPGGPEGGRSQFAVAVLGRVRDAMGPEAIVGLRLCCDELAPWAGITPDDALELAAALAPLVDYLMVVRGSLYSLDATTPDTHAPTGVNIELAARVARRIAGRTLVGVQGSVVDLDEASNAIARGIDLVEMTRAQIADPDLAAKATRRSTTSIRPCLRCNQRCRVRDVRNPIVSCTVNPSAGFELSEPETGSPSQPARELRQRSIGDRVHVVGAGPAGLELARLIAEAGLSTIVHDRLDRTGGIVPCWATASGRQPLAAIVEWQTHECQRAGVAFELGAEIDAAAVRSWGADVVVLCTGAKERTAEYDIEGGATVMSSMEALDAVARGAITAEPMVVWDPIGGPVGVSVAETLAECLGAGDAVTLVTPDLVAGTLLSLSGDLAAAGTRLHRLGVTVRKRARLRSVGPTACVVQDVHSGTMATVAASLVVDAGHRVPERSLWHATGERLRCAGDAVAPRSIYEALLEARQLAAQLLSARQPLRSTVT